MALFRWLMLPSNLVCDHFGLVDENERSMVRMLVNTFVWTTLLVTLFLFGWLLFG
jgi:hypothetical protein